MRDLASVLEGLRAGPHVRPGERDRETALGLAAIRAELQYLSLDLRAMGRGGAAHLLEVAVRDLGQPDDLTEMS